MQLSRRREGDLAVIDHVLEVPLDHDEPGGRRLELFAREILLASKENLDLPRMVFLQGGPGGKSPRPDGRTPWLNRAARDYRVVLLDQRGTGRSTPANRQSLAGLGNPAAQADYLAYFRADAIVRDAELLRRELQGDTPWTLLAQSFGGFCTLTYLSFAPEGVREAFVTGGLAPVVAGIDDVYRITYARTREHNEVYFERYPEDRDTCLRVLRRLSDHDVRLPTGERLTPQRFQTVGQRLGMTSAYAGLHYLLEEAFVPGGSASGGGGPSGSGADAAELSDTFLAGVSGLVSLATNPLYSLVHEPSYCHTPGMAGRWSAERIRAEFPEFGVEAIVAGETPFLFTGEMMYPFQLDEDPALVPLRETAHLLADKADWPALYDLDRLARNDVPVFAALYFEDMYVVREFSLDTAARVPKVRPWITNEFEHDGLSMGTTVLDHLFAMAAERR